MPIIDRHGIPMSVCLLTCHVISGVSGFEFEKYRIFVSCHIVTEACFHYFFRWPFCLCSFNFFLLDFGTFLAVWYFLFFILPNLLRIAKCELLIDFFALMISSYGTWISGEKKDFSSIHLMMYFFIYQNVFCFLCGDGGLLKSFKFSLICNNSSQTQKADYSTYRKKWLASKMFLKLSTP